MRYAGIMLKLRISSVRRTASLGYRPLMDRKKFCSPIGIDSISVPLGRKVPPDDSGIAGEITQLSFMQNHNVEGAGLNILCHH